MTLPNAITSLATVSVMLDPQAICNGRFPSRVLMMVDRDLGPPAETRDAAQQVRSFDPADCFELSI
jgi:hypothetical protein